MEIWDIYDINRQKTGRTHQRGIPLKEGDFQLVVHIWIINDKDELLIQKRQPWKVMWPNMWDCSAAGCAIAGDNSKEAAIREVVEELGIDLDKDKLKMAFTINHSWGFDDIWIIRQNVEIGSLKLQSEEVAEVKWARLEQIKIMIEDKIFIQYEYVDKLFQFIKR